MSDTKNMPEMSTKTLAELNDDFYTLLCSSIDNIKANSDDTLIFIQGRVTDFGVIDPNKITYDDKAVRALLSSPDSIVTATVTIFEKKDFQFPEHIVGNQVGFIKVVLRNMVLNVIKETFLFTKKISAEQVAGI